MKLKYWKNELSGAAAILALAGCLNGAVTSSRAAETPGALKGPRAISLLPKMGDLHHPVSTTNEMAQRFFDQGLTFVYGFNHDAAIRSFQRALEHDPNLAMAQWGIALALGPNINVPVSPEAEKAAFDAARRAVEMAAKPGACTQAEKDYIAALSVRYSIEPKADLVKLDLDYSAEMRKLVEKYPDDLDAATLCAESLMNLKPWQYWSADGQPAEGTQFIVDTLESVLRRDPSHPGANHYYIHAVEASPFPERALPSAARLETQVPAAGHLIHMPSHIYIRTGDYAAAARRNEIASEVDFDFVQACGVQGVYPALYTSHNLHFAAVAHLLQGRYAPARRYAERLLAHAGPMAEQIADLEPFLPTLEQVLVAFGKWEEILALPEPKEKFKVHRAFWHFARAMAFASTGRLEEAEQARSSLAAIRAAISPDQVYGFFNKAVDIMAIAETQVKARIALSRGDTVLAVQLLREILPVEDQLRYMEPPDWYLFTREALGGALLSAGQFSEAESVFREDLKRNHRKGRALYGLRASLEQQGKKAPAKLVGQGFAKAWENADGELPPEAIWWVGAKR